MGVQAGVADSSTPNNIVCELLGHDEKVIVGEAGEKITPPTSCSQPVAVKSSEVQFQSPATIHGPLSRVSTKLIASNKRRLHWAETPTAEVR